MCACGPSQWVCVDNPANCLTSHLILIQVYISLPWEVSSSAAQLSVSSINSCPLSCAQKWLWFIKPPPYLKKFILRHGCNRDAELLWILDSDKIYSTRVSTDCVTLTGQDKWPLSIGKVGWVYMYQCYGRDSHFPGSRAKKTVTDDALCGVFGTKSNWLFSTEAILLKLCCAAKLPMHIQKHKK